MSSNLPPGVNGGMLPDDDQWEVAIDRIYEKAMQNNLDADESVIVFEAGILAFKHIFDFLKKKAADAERGDVDYESMFNMCARCKRPITSKTAPKTLGDLIREHYASTDSDIPKKEVTPAPFVPDGKIVTETRHGCAFARCNQFYVCTPLHDDGTYSMYDEDWSDVNCDLFDNPKRLTYDLINWTKRGLI